MMIFNGSDVQKSIKINIADASRVFLFSTKNPDSSDFETVI